MKVSGETDDSDSSTVRQKGRNKAESEDSERHQRMFKRREQDDIGV